MSKKSHPRLLAFIKDCHIHFSRQRESIVYWAKANNLSKQEVPVQLAFHALERKRKQAFDLAMEIYRDMEE